MKAGKSRYSTMQEVGPYMGMGFQLAAAMVAFGALGWWLDGQLGTAPWLMVVGLLMGATGGMVNIIRISLRSSKKPSNSRKP